jgi:hypothetical protein
VAGAAKHVGIVDDDAAVRLALSRLLRLAGYEVLTAGAPIVEISGQLAPAGEERAVPGPRGMRRKGIFSVWGIATARIVLAVAGLLLRRPIESTAQTGQMPISDSTCSARVIYLAARDTARYQLF